MADQTKEYILVHLIDKESVGSLLGKGIPLHMTALHWFSLDCDRIDIIHATESALKDLKQIDTVATHDDLFGPEHDIPVIRLKRTPDLLQLHTSLMQSMKELGAKFDERWIGAENWNPHVTHKSNRRLHTNDKLLINDIDLIVRDGKHGSREIVHRFKLNA